MRVPCLLVEKVVLSNCSWCTVQYGQWLRRGRQTSASRAISGPKALANYGFLKEVTLRLDPVLAIWRRGAFGPDKNPHMRPISRAMDTQYEADRPHYPFWIVPARDSMLRSYESCGIILPLDHRFKRRRHRDRLRHANSTTGDSSWRTTRRSSLSAARTQPQQPARRELRQSRWSVRVAKQMLSQRQGLGLATLIAASRCSGFLAAFLNGNRATSSAWSPSWSPLHPSRPEQGTGT